MSDRSSVSLWFKIPQDRMDTTMPTAQELITYLRLQPHPKEGGFFRETYRADESIAPRRTATLGRAISRPPFIIC